MADKPADYGTPAEALRLMKEPMPKGFRWNFRFSLRHTHCGTAGCAIGELGLKCGESHPHGSWVVKRFGFDEDAADALFFDAHPSVSPYGHADVDAITRADVIRALERYVTTGELDGE